jgi:hypothetical protein
MTDPVFTKLSDIKPRRVDWFWEPFIPYEMITILEGDPGTGKSFIAMHLAAEMSRGGALPNGKILKPGNVLYISAEDDPQYTTRPRVDAMGGDATRIHVLTGYLQFDDDGLDVLEAELSEVEPDLVIVDPWVSFVPAKTKVTDSNAIRQILSKLGLLARDYGFAMLMIRHLVKSKQENALYQGGGTMDLIAYARSALRVGNHPNKPGSKVMAHLKHNVGPKGDSWEYSLDLSTIEGGVPSLQFVGEVNISVEQLSNTTTGDRLRPSEAAEAFLKHELAGGLKPSKVLARMAEQEGITQRTLDRAKKTLGIHAVQKKRKWYWKLPD